MNDDVESGTVAVSATSQLGLTIDHSLPAAVEPHQPGDSHRYRIECEVCGQRGVTRLTIDPEIEPADSHKVESQLRELIREATRSTRRLDNYWLDHALTIVRNGCPFDCDACLAMEGDQ